MKDLKAINPDRYDYPLPQDRIAKYPLPRGTSKLLHYQKGKIEHLNFAAITDLLDAEHLLVVNNTKVLPARMHFVKDTGAQIEIFLLNPVLPTPVITEAMLVKNECTWHCTIGNLKRWKEEVVLIKTVELDNGTKVEVKAAFSNRENREIRFSWEEDVAFVDLVEAAGKTPLPPYIKREAEESDKTNYQTVYSKNEGAVAAPTAGLHFTDEIIQQLAQKGVAKEEVTLHVGAGTFQPIKVDNAIEHDMHQEQIEVTLANLKALKSGKQVVAVGTTSMRTLESLYWYGVKLLKDLGEDFFIEKLFPYRFESTELPSLADAMTAIEELMKEKQVERLMGETQIYIFPSYQFQVCKGLITNFHMPHSTLLLLIAAFIGEDWKNVYQAALAQDYRFLSYGDSSFLQPKA
ncbi:MAG: S-adenosylmethionine:tRNA ribosyltransferase-isomerase [Flammeovirgaceae bacterium]